MIYEKQTSRMRINMSCRSGSIKSRSRENLTIPTTNPPIYTKNKSCPCDLCPGSEFCLAPVRCNTVPHPQFQEYCPSTLSLRACSTQGIKIVEEILLWKSLTLRSDNNTQRVNTIGVRDARKIQNISRRWEQQLTHGYHNYHPYIPPLNCEYYFVRVYVISIHFYSTHINNVEA